MTPAGIALPGLSGLDRVASAAGWTLVHSFWQGLLAWVIVVLAGRWLRSPKDRIFVGNLALAALVLVQLATFVLCLRFAGRPWWNSASPSSELSQSGLFRMQAGETVGWAGRLFAHADSFMPLMLVAWAAFACVQIACHLRACRAVATTLSLAPALPPALLARCRQFAGELGVRKPVQFVVAAISDAPGTIGWLRPYIFVPPAVLLTMTPSQVEAIVLHELAHILRRDYAVALLHALAEAAYVGNPFVRAIVRRLRDDVELCCDEIAARHFGDARGYAGALVAIADSVAASRAILSAGGGVLRARVLRLLAPPLSGARGAMLLPKLAAAFLIGAAAVSLAGGSVTRSMSRQAEAARLAEMSLNDAVIWILGTDDTRGNRGGLLKLAENRTGRGETKLGRAILESTTYADGTIDEPTRDRLLAAVNFDNSRGLRLSAESRKMGSMDAATFAWFVHELSFSANGRTGALCFLDTVPEADRPRIEAAIRGSGTIDPLPPGAVGWTHADIVITTPPRILPRKPIFSRPALP